MNDTIPDSATVPAIERVARAIAEMKGDDFDLVPKNKTAWIDARGVAQDRFRDINEPFQIDYLDYARAAIEALREPTEAMKWAGALVKGAHKNPIVSRWKAGAPDIWQAMIDAALEEPTRDGG